MLRISTRGRYALRAMIDLALHAGEGPILRQEIARRQDISAEYVAQLFSALQKAGLVKSAKGPGGGYRLARDPEAITALDILQAVEGPVAVVRCVLPEEPACSRVDRCVAYLLWKRLSIAISEVLSTVTLRQLCDEAQRLECAVVPGAGRDVGGEPSCPSRPEQG
ncbi:MAG: Rrf2 family transcriptional regulator [Anaerolineae bacterium]|nr:Rrf2 family transcriptional regulator [Anaerolineae bacterium]